jgi:hypothetical protein
MNFHHTLSDSRITVIIPPCQGGDDGSIPFYRSLELLYHLLIFTSMGRKQKKYHYIYKTTNIITGKYYIGMHSTDNLEDGYIGSGKRLWYSVKKYGKENFKCEILEMLPDRSSLKGREKELVNEDLLKDKMCLNLAVGGEGGFGNLFLTKEQLQKGRKTTDTILKEKYGNNFRSIITKNYYNTLSDEEKKQHREKIRQGKINSNFDCGSTFRGKKHREETKRKIGEKNSNNQKGKKNSQFGSCWITNGIDVKKIKKNDILPDGWRKGRK